MLFICYIYILHLGHLANAFIQSDICQWKVKQVSQCTIITRVSYPFCYTANVLTSVDILYVVDTVDFLKMLLLVPHDEQNRQLLRDRFMVELVEGCRKLRHVFLFTDLLLCTKLKKQAAGWVAAASHTHPSSRITSSHREKQN